MIVQSYILAQHALATSCKLSSLSLEVEQPHNNQLILTLKSNVDAIPVWKQSNNGALWLLAQAKDLQRDLEEVGHDFAKYDNF